MYILIYDTCMYIYIYIYIYTHTSDRHQTQAITTPAETGYFIVAIFRERWT